MDGDVLAYLTGRKIKQRVVISPKYIVGDTFPARLASE